MHSHFFLTTLSTVSLAQGLIGASSSTPGLCDSLDFKNLLNPVCRSPRRPATSLDLDTLQGGQWPTGDSRTGQQTLTISMHPVNKRPEWSHKPRCIRLENSTEVYCTYTSPHFARGHGISIWTSPEEMESILALPAFTNPTVFEGMNEEPNPPFIAKELPGRGIGLIANRTIYRGDRIFSHTPVFLAHQDLFDTFVLEDRIPMQRTAIQRLPPKARSAFMALCGHFGGDHIEDVLNTNSFAVDLNLPGGSADEYIAVFPEISRLNHACRPNTHYHFDPLTLTQHVQALTTIHPGTELTISYIDPVKTYSFRQEALHTSWGFHCSCSLCTQPRAQRQETDRRIAEILKVQEALQDYNTPNSDACPAMAEYLVSLYRQEHLFAPIAEAYGLAAIEYAGVMDQWNAKKYANLAIEAGLLYGGEGDEDVAVMKQIVRDPKGHWSWGLRAKMKARMKGDGDGDSD